jgi:hypothetical protein
MSYLSNPMKGRTAPPRRVTRREIASLASDAMGAVASLAILLALSYILVRGSLFTLSGLQGIFRAEMEIIAKGVAAITFVFVMGALLFPITKLWLVMASALRSYLLDMRRRVSVWMHPPSAGENLAGECVGAHKQQLKMAGKHMRWVINELELEVDHITLAMLCYVLHIHSQHLRSTEQQTLEGVLEYLCRLIVSPAGDLFDRAVAEGACATQLIEDLLACGI